MKAFDLKYVIFSRVGGSPEVSCFTEDKRRNRVPMIFDTAADAVIEIADHMRLVAEAVKRGDMLEENLDEAFDKHVAQCSLDKKGNFEVWIEDGSDESYEPETIYSGTYNKFVIQNN